jgi:glycopeptide antibiotics resistance protein
LVVAEQQILPWFLPGVGLALLCGLLFRERIAFALQIRAAYAVVLVVSLGATLAATLTPLYGVFEGIPGAHGCDFSRLGFVPLGLLLHVNDESMNILLFVPLGLSIALVPPSRRRTLLALGAMALPVLIEATQLLVPMLDRGCESGDVIDNLTGLGVGGVIGTILVWLRGRSRP